MRTTYPSKPKGLPVEAGLTQAVLRRTDPVSQVCNRLGLEEALAGGAHLCLPDQVCALISLKLSHYNLLCAAYGGDHVRPLLRALGECLSASAGQRGLAARVQEDTFVLILPGLADSAAARCCCAELLATVQQLRMAQRPALRLWVEHTLTFLPPDEVVPLPLVLSLLAQDESAQSAVVAPLESQGARPHLRDV